MVTLYPDQEDIAVRVKAAFSKHRAVILEMPTGTGKTVVATSLLRDLHAVGGKFLTLAHRRYILDQFMQTAQAAGLRGEIGWIVSQGEPLQLWRQHQFAMVQTLVRRLDDVSFKPSLIVIDECHHAMAKTYRDILKRFKGVPVLGLSATPERPDGKGLGEIFTHIVDSPPVHQYIEWGRLAPYEVYGLDLGDKPKSIDNRKELERALLKSNAIANAVPWIEKLCAGRRWIAFGPTINASKDLEERLKARDVSCKHIDQNTRNLPRVLADFAAGRWDGLLSVDLISEGMDCPAADCAVLYRKTKSEVYYRQAVGRVLRPLDGKTARILDMAQLMQKFGKPCADRKWSLEGRKAARTAETQSLIRKCPTCFMWTPAGKPCVGCGAIPPPPEIDTVDVEMVKIDLAGFKTEVAKVGGKLKADDLRRLKHEALKHGYSGLSALGKQLGYSPKWARVQQSIYKRYRR